MNSKYFKKKWAFFIQGFLFMFLTLTGFSNPQDPIIFKKNSSGNLIGTSIQYALDIPQNWTPQQIIREADFKISNDLTLTLGILDKPVWVYFSVLNQSEEPEISIELRYQQIDSLELFEFDGPTVHYLGLKGDKTSSNGEGNIEVTPRYILNISPGEQKTYLMRVVTHENMVIPLSISVLEDLKKRDQSNNLFFGIYAGIMLVMFLYNLVIFLIVKDRSYLFYIIYIFSIGMAQASITGYAKAYLWPDAVNFQQFSVVFFSVLAGLGGLSFLQYFLHLKENAPKLNKVLKVFLVVYSLALLSHIIGLNKATYGLLDFGGISVAIFALITSAYLAIKGNRSAKFYLVAWVLFLTGLIIFVLRMIGVLPFNFLTENAIQIGSATEAILLSIALADRINILKKDKEKSQAEALAASKETERVIREQNVFLETKVNERTVELSKANDEISQTLKNLQETQTQLVESEKMASLGQLTAGVAHEINNPINFVSSNVKPLERDIQEIISIIDRYDQFAEGEVKETIEKYKRQIDFDYLKEEVSMLLKGIQEGANRTVEIVHSLRNFSRLDEQDLKRADIHDGLDSTLVLLNSSMGGMINIVKNYAEIPEVDCYPGKLNQVFMNIFTNSIYAIKSKYDGQSGGEITITTTQDQDNIYISIKDNGIGMPHDILVKIFDPFYTSKPVGEGTGLGLSIVYKIIENHSGTIKVDSKEGEWTEFMISLPKQTES